MQRQHKEFYDKDTIIRIPIPDVLRDRGIPLNRQGFFKIRPNEKTASVKYYPATNTFCDFGNCRQGGNVINLICTLDNVNAYGAMQYLSQMYSVAPLYSGNTDKAQRREIIITDSQYSKIGIAGDLATKNMQFNFEDYSLEQNMKLSQKYHMSMNELKKSYPQLFQKIIKIKAVPYVQEYQQCLLNEMRTHFVFKSIVSYCKKMDFSFPIGSTAENRFLNDFECDKDRLKILALVLGSDPKQYGIKSYESCMEMYCDAISCLNYDEVYKIVENNPLWKETIAGFDKVSNEQVVEQLIMQSAGTAVKNQALIENFSKTK